MAIINEPARVHGLLTGPRQRHNRIGAQPHDPGPASEEVSEQPTAGNAINTLTAAEIQPCTVMVHADADSAAGTVSEAVNVLGHAISHK
jgi:hypothetical protein